MSKLLIAVKSCLKDCLRGYHDEIKKTWGSDVAPADLRFFVGRDTTKDDREVSKLPSGTVYLGEAKDDYDSLPFKTREILKWFLGKHYSHIFLCDNDTFVVMKRLLATGFENYDYCGRFGTTHPVGTTFDYQDARGSYKNVFSWASGGVGYFLSRYAAEIITQERPKHWAEDFYVSQCLGGLIQTGEVKAKDLDNFEGYAAWHFPRKEYDNQVYDPKFGWHQKMYAEHK